MNFEYGKDADIKRFADIVESGGGYAIIKLDKMPEGKLTNMANIMFCDVDHPLFSTITARYYKGIGAHKDNMILEIVKVENE